MKPTIFLIENLTTPNTNVVKQLTKELLLPKYSSRTTFFPNSFNQDLLCVIELGGLKVGLMDHANVTQSPSHLLDFFSNKACNLIFCSSVKNEELQTTIEKLSKSQDIKFIHLKRIWTGNSKNEDLENYQVNKLLEIITIFSGASSLTKDEFVPKANFSSDLIA